jgi:formate dehydrogenase subunit gamma
MGKGDVDLNWAKTHHALWLQKEAEKGRVPKELVSATPAE